MDKRTRSGLEAIRKVLDYDTNGSEMRYNMMVWTKNAIDDLLAGRRVKEPPRKSRSDPLPHFTDGTSVPWADTPAKNEYSHLGDFGKQDCFR